MHRASTLPPRRPLAASLLFAGMIASTPLAVATSAAQADRHGPIVVTHCGDAGPGSLREAYAQAIHGDEIDLGQLACSTITLTSGALVDDASVGSLVIRGPA